MGYDTDFRGEFTLDRELAPEHRAYLEKFAETRRMVRAPHLLAYLPDPVREAAGLPVGHQGAYFVGGLGFMGQDRDPSVCEGNYPPAGQPSLWCQWRPTPDGMGIEWNGSEKFYDFVPWLEYLIEHFLKPWGYVLNGNVEWQGEDPSDMGIIRCNDNVVRAYPGRVVYEG